jgi:genome maintenance exonuclease 1
MSIKLKTFAQAGEHFDEVEVIEGTPRLYQTPYGSFPSVTSILSVLTDPNDNGLENWRKRIGYEEADRITKEASDRGNALHDYNEKYLLNELKRSELKGQAKILFNRVKRYLDEVELTIATEVPLWNINDQYAGRVDAIVMMDGHLTILDHKNSRRPIDINTKFGRRKCLKYQIQTCAYGRALYEMRGWRATKGCLIVGNHLTSTADKFFFDLEPLEAELDLVVEAYHRNSDAINRSMYFQL